MKGYSTKYCLTAGIQAVEIDLEFGWHPDNHVYQEGDYVYTKGMYRTQLRFGRNFFLTKDEAEKAAKKVAQRKLKSLQKQCDAMKVLAQKPKYEREQ